MRKGSLNSKWGSLWKKYKWKNKATKNLRYLTPSALDSTKLRYKSGLSHQPKWKTHTNSRHLTKLIMRKRCKKEKIKKRKKRRSRKRKSKRRKKIRSISTSTGTTHKKRLTRKKRKKSITREKSRIRMKGEEIVQDQNKSTEKDVIHHLKAKVIQTDLN